MATSNVDENYFSKTLDENNIQWVPLSLTLVEYPKGKGESNVRFHPLIIDLETCDIFLFQVISLANLWRS